MCASLKQRKGPPSPFPFRYATLSDMRYLYGRYIYVTYVREDPPHMKP